MASLRVQYLKQRQWSLQYHKNKQKTDLKLSSNKSLDAQQHLIDLSITTDEASTSFSFESNTTDSATINPTAESTLILRKVLI